ncbi:MAG TPA: signal peptidase II [Candidatus Edwardsbacteria bacterium]|nr:signal peptidase II [Candidatus Edwardsbacteria bacterium]
MKNRIMLAAVALGVFALDQATKLLVQSSLALGESRPLLGDLVRLTYIVNPNGLMGMSFGPWSRYLMLPLSLLAIAAIIYFYYHWKNPGALSSAAMGLILAGAAGNLLDRFHYGTVIDFIDCDIPDIHVPAFKFLLLHFPGYHLERWYIFNVADSAVLVGVTLLLVITVLKDRRAAAAQAPQP